MANFFEGISLSRIHKWYLDCAKTIESLTGSNSTASQLLTYYLSPDKQHADTTKNKVCLQVLENGANEYTTGTYVLSEDYLKKTKEQSNYYNIMQKTYIPIFFSETNINKGIIPRRKNFPNKDEFEIPWVQSLGFSSFETVGMINDLNSYIDKISDKQIHDKDFNISDIVPKDKQDKFDVFVGLHNYAVQAEVKIKLTSAYDFKKPRAGSDNKLEPESIFGSIKSWKSIFIDYYDFNQEVGFTLPNPDYTGNKSSPGKIHPEMKKVDYDDLKHGSLVKMITAGLAKPFFVYGECQETDNRLLIKNRRIKK
jgi:hypothetical protein